MKILAKHMFSWASNYISLTLNLCQQYKSINKTNAKASQPSEMKDAHKYKMIIQLKYS